MDIQLLAAPPARPESGKGHPDQEPSPSRSDVDARPALPPLSANGLNCSRSLKESPDWGSMPIVDKSEPLGWMVRRRRQSADLTLEQLSEASGVSDRAL